MIATHKTEVVKDLANKTLFITREFEATLDKVWKAWTDSSLLDKWWAPKPWKAETKSMSFKNGGYWLYCMVGPDGSRHWARADYSFITLEKQFSFVDCFCDENGNPSQDAPSMNWVNKFTETTSGTKVEVTVKFSSVADLEKIIEMGFQEGFTMAHGNLDELLAA